MAYTLQEENVQRQDIEHTVSTDIEGLGYMSAKKRSWKYYLWDSFNKSKEEQHLIFKSDLTLVTFGCLGTFIKYIDKYGTSHSPGVIVLTRQDPIYNPHLFLA